MITLNFPTEQNLIQIESLKNYKCKTEENQSLLNRRIAFAEREIQFLREFANLKPNGRVAEHCNRIANEIENRLNLIIK
jgi:hypothetical protein